MQQAASCARLLRHLLCTGFHSIATRCTTSSSKKQAQDAPAAKSLNTSEWPSPAEAATCLPCPSDSLTVCLPVRLPVCIHLSACLPVQWSGSQGWSQAQDKPWKLGGKQVGEVTSFNTLSFVKVYQAVSISTCIRSLSPDRAQGVVCGSGACRSFLPACEHLHAVAYSWCCLTYRMLC
jgi:hypothetical protein